jgi:hypothetical protein
MNDVTHSHPTISRAELAALQAAMVALAQRIERMEEAVATLVRERAMGGTMEVEDGSR